jgi:hypothetical protein
MTSYRLDTYSRGKLQFSDIVDGVDNDDLALKLILADHTSGHCKLYRDDVLIADCLDGLWTLLAQRSPVPLKRPARRVARSYRPRLEVASHVAA